MNNKIKKILDVLAMGVVCCTTSYGQTHKFDFGNGPVAEGYTAIKTDTKYSDKLGYGIEKGNVSSVDRQWDNDLITDFLTTKDELFFSVKLPQGNYEVKIIFGDGENDSETTVKVENRRLIFDRVTTAGGVFVQGKASIRKMETKSINGKVTMSIKDREKTYYTWDNKLTFRISGKAPAIAGIEITPKEDVVTLWLCGNSTVVDQLNEPWAGWGQMIPNFLKSSASVANYAESGLTSGGFLSMKRLDKILEEVKKGDYVFVEFGHNDQKSSTDTKNYSNNLKKFSDNIKSKGAIPVFVTPTARQGDTDVKTSIGGLAQEMRETAKKLGVVYLDLNQKVIELQKSLGNNKQELYMYTENDKTHFCNYGGYELARAILKEMESKLPDLKQHFRDNYVSFDTSDPDPTNYLSQSKEPIMQSNFEEDDSNDNFSITDFETLIQGESFCDADGVIESTNDGYDGMGYLNFENEQGAKATYLINTNAAYSHEIHIRYANGDSNPRNVAINGTEVEFPSTGSWTTWKTVKVKIELPASDTTLEFVSLDTHGGPNLDWIGFLEDGVSAAVDCNGTSDLSDRKEYSNSCFGYYDGKGIVLTHAPRKTLTMNLFDVTGKKIETIRGLGNRFDIDASQGTYLVEIQTEDGPICTFKVRIY